jgi:hypothetical protein
MVLHDQSGDGTLTPGGIRGRPSGGIVGCFPSPGFQEGSGQAQRWPRCMPHRSGSARRNGFVLQIRHLYAFLEYPGFARPPRALFCRVFTLIPEQMPVSLLGKNGLTRTISQSLDTT